MQPEGRRCQVQVVNATGQDLLIGAATRSFYAPFGAYQMAEWFSDLKVGDVLAKSGTYDNNYFVQFLSGGGDDTDGASMPVALGTYSTDVAKGSAGQVNNLVFELLACSGAASTHFMYIVPMTGDSVPKRTVLGIFGTGLFQNARPSDISWLKAWTWHEQDNDQPRKIMLNLPYAVAIIVVDLDHIYDSETARALYDAIGAATLDSNELVDLFGQVAGTCMPPRTSLAYELIDVHLQNVPQNTPTEMLVNESIITNTTKGSITKSLDFNKSMAQSFSLSSTQIWGVGVEIPFKIPLGAADGTLNGSFEYQGGEQAQTTGNVSLSVQYQITLGPGTWKVFAYINMATNVTVGFEGKLHVAASVPIPGVGRYSLNGTTISRILKDPHRNHGTTITTFIPGPNSNIASVSGTITGTFGLTSNVDARPYDPAPNIPDDDNHRRDRASVT